MSQLQFDVHPSVAFQLGADLISDDAQALLELVRTATTPRLETLASKSIPAPVHQMCSPLPRTQPPRGSLPSPTMGSAWI